MSAIWIMWYNLLQQQNGLNGRSASLLSKKVMPVEIKDVLTLMISFAGFTVTLIGLIVTIVIALNNQNKKK